MECSRMTQIKQYINDIPEMLEKKRAAEEKQTSEAIMETGSIPIHYSMDQVVDASIKG